MTKLPADWKMLIIKFQTSEITPPPYAYFFTLTLTKADEGLLADFDHQYLDRDELEEEAILEEGFELNSDYAWKGELSAVWQKELDKLLSKTSYRPERKTNDTEDYIELVFPNKNSGDERYFPTNIADFEYFLQEIMQAIYEVSEKEQPFKLDYRNIDRLGESKINCRAAFAERIFSVQQNDEPPKILGWKWTQEVMGTVFMADFVTEEATREVPKFSGKYLSLGDGLWYEFGETLVEPAPDSEVLPRIKKLLDQLGEEAAR
ncbi:hypothetical protein [Persicitalea sp.]|uniref:hypothetical protein n=1 Tax=Persicitalea sp. TaxID=3100273 RepID=UPI003593BD94